MKRSIKIANLLSGLNTTGLEDGLELPAWAEFQNTRVSEGAAKRRAGMQRVLVADNQYGVPTDFDNAIYMVIPQNDDQMQLGRYWTVETLIAKTDISVDGTAVDFLSSSSTTRPLTIHVASDTLTVDLRTSAGLTTLTHDVTGRDGEAIRVQVARDNLTVYLRVDGADADSDTLGDYDLLAPSGGIILGRTYDETNGKWNGDISFLRILDIYLSDQKYGGSICPDPKAPFVRGEWVPYEDESTTHRADDRSSFRNHGYLSTSPSTGTQLGAQVTPVTMIEPRIDYANKGRLDVVAGGRIYLGELTR